MIHLIEYEDQYAADFRRLNLQWLEAYNLLESHDLLVLDNPRGVLDRGGYIWLALAIPDDQVAGATAAASRGSVVDQAPSISAVTAASRSAQVVGTAALMHEHDGIYELAKMSVAPAFRGQGISKLLIEQCLRKAKDIGAGKLVLYSNSQLQTAIQLYTKYGFRHVPAVDTPFVTADVKMELMITP
ncbi:MAG TPA: GNAT family N-acetyltransferase [Puia sp.]|nr:GNAT family N-acetyltransferase [Puia sp.]